MTTTFEDPTCLASSCSLHHSSLNLKSYLLDLLELAGLEAESGRSNHTWTASIAYSIWVGYCFVWTTASLSNRSQLGSFSRMPTCTQLPLSWSWPCTLARWSLRSFPSWAAGHSGRYNGFPEAAWKLSGWAFPYFPGWPCGTTPASPCHGRSPSRFLAVFSPTPPSFLSTARLSRCALLRPRGTSSWSYALRLGRV